MKKIRLKGAVNKFLDSDVINEKTVLEALKDVKEDIKVSLTTEGGDIFEAFSIYNAITGWKDETGKTAEVFIDGLVASAGTYIALAFDKITANHSSVIMIHNPMTMAYGSYSDLLSTSEKLKNIGNISKAKYAQKMGKDMEEIQTLMDNETFYYGKEIVTSGFADNYAESAPQELDIEKIKQTYRENTDINTKNMFKFIQKYDTMKVTQYDNKERNKSMLTVEQIKNEYPELYNNIFKEGYNAKSSEVRSHLKWYENGSNLQTVIDNINNDKPITYEEINMYASEVINKRTAEKFNADNVATPKVDHANESAIINNNQDYYNPIEKIKSLSEVING